MANVKFYNCTYFILPIKICNTIKFFEYLEGNESWNKCNQPIKVNYLLRYASKLLDKTNDKYQSYSYIGNFPKVTDFSARIKQKLEIEYNGKPEIGNITLHIFSTNIAFLEFKILYNNMPIDAIVEYIYLFRSLRNTKTEKNSWLKIDPNDIDLITAIQQILPENQTFTQLCFSNPSEVKKQCVIFTMISTKHMENCDLKEDEIGRYRYLLAHGFDIKTPYEKPSKQSGESNQNSQDFSTQYELLYNISSKSFWGGSQDGLVCITSDPFIYQYPQLCNDYHFMYLLLLNQRFTSLSLIYDLTESNDDSIHAIYDRIIDLKTRFSFRVISDDRFYQNIYHKMYNVLEIDDCLKDIEDTNDQLRNQQQRYLEKQQKIQEKHDKKISNILLGLSVLAVFSALIDLATFLDRFLPYNQVLLSAVSLIINGLIITYFVLFRDKNK